jgi:hypothetical protein
VIVAGALNSQGVSSLPTAEAKVFDQFIDLPAVNLSSTAQATESQVELITSSHKRGTYFIDPSYELHNHLGYSLAK